MYWLVVHGKKVGSKGFIKQTNSNERKAGIFLSERCI